MAAADVKDRAGTRARPDARFRLGRRWRKTTLIVHLVSAGAWIGIDVMVAVLVLTGHFGATADVRGLAYRALATFVVWPMLTSGLICLVTGLILGLGTRWGLLRHWWVAIKLVLNLVLCALILLLLRPGMDQVGDYGRTLTPGAPEPEFISKLFYPPAVSLTALTLATVLSVAKPWGRVRDRHPGKRDRYPAPRQD
ncbi:hypothetical protein [Actinomadura formosensis]|uniref:hypothetical protein n=1 Tax=Actinomadura formosensis TaxID=60706 RepID=UPI000A0150E0|nr:hypothetical protein [Actinomadura formosensis]